ncbi:MAG: CDP-glycerol glycerophosphotransferase family protein [Christensenellales bacterium]
MLQSTAKRMLVVLVNILTCLVNVFLPRKRTIWLFGSWMGDKFADNSRYLFQYVNENKSKYSIKYVVWVTRNNQVYNMLKAMKYKAYMMHSPLSYYFHLRAGVHVICNMYAQTGKYKGDILGNLSCGAKRIQLWHGVGIKACNLMTNRAKSIKKSSNSTIVLMKHILSLKMLSPGCWKENFFAASSDENMRVAIYDYGYRKENVFLALPPRLLNPIGLTSYEKAIISILKEEKKKGKKIVLYLPTFREAGDEAYVNPAEIEGFDEFVESNDILWVEKRHTASAIINGNNTKGFLKLSDDIDINTVLEFLNLLVTDYSSASSDCIFRGIKVLSYIPDYERYTNDERGFVNDYDQYYPGIKIYKSEDFFSGIRNSLSDSYCDEIMTYRYEKAKKLLYVNDCYSYDRIITKILETIKS